MGKDRTELAFYGGLCPLDKSSHAPGVASGAPAHAQVTPTATDGPEGREIPVFRARTRGRQAHALAANVERAGSRPRFTMGATAPIPRVTLFGRSFLLRRDRDEVPATIKHGMVKLTRCSYVQAQQIDRVGHGLGE